MFRLVGLGDARDHLPLFEADVDLELEQLFRFLDLLRFQNNTRAEVQLHEILDRHLFRDRGDAGGLRFIRLFLSLGGGENFLRFFFLDAREQLRARLRLRPRCRLAPCVERSQPFVFHRCRQPQLLPQGHGGGGHERVQQYRREAQGFGGVVENRAEPLFAFVGFGQVPRCGVVDVDVGRVEKLPDGHQDFIERQF